jgi:hypothetical protein
VWIKRRKIRTSEELPAWEASSRWVSVSFNPKVYCRILKRPEPDKSSPQIHAVSLRPVLTISSKKSLTYRILETKFTHLSSVPCWPRANQFDPTLFHHSNNIMTCISIARQRLGEHIPEEVKSCKNRTSISRQRISIHTSLKIDVVFSASSVQCGSKKCSVVDWAVKFWVSCQKMRYCRELGRDVEMAVEGNWEEMTKSELDCAKKTSCVIWSAVRLL